MKKHITTILLVLVFVVGLFVLLYPTISDYVNSKNQSRAMASYSREIQQIDRSEYIAIIDRAKEYNEKLRAKAERYRMTDDDLAEYKSLLRAGMSDVIGFIEVPAINVKLPIYHGTNEAVLQLGVGHMEGTSLPVGGAGTHSALSGHRGLPSAKLFSDLDKIVVGDVFHITVLDEVLTYEVDQIVVVEPIEMDELAFVEGVDYSTLVTCTPYGINSHRLLVRGVRKDNVVVEASSLAGKILIFADARRIEKKHIAPIVAIPVVITLIIYILFKYKKRKERS